MKRIQLFLCITFLMTIKALSTPITGAHTISSGASYINDIVIGPGGVLTIQNCTIQFVANKGIIVKDGGKLILSNATLEGTSSTNVSARWRGIEVEDDLDGIPNTSVGDAVYATSSRIFNAVKGVHNWQVGGVMGQSIYINNCEFKDNSAHIKMVHHTSSLSNGNQKIFISDTKFHGGTSITQTYRINSITIDHVKNVFIRNCEFKSAPITTLLNNNASTCIWMNACQDVTISDNHFNHQYRYGVAVGRFVKNLKITYNQFESADYINHPWNYSNYNAKPLYIAGYEFPQQVGNVLEISNNDFFVESASCPYGIDAIDVPSVYNDILISNNNITDVNYGMNIHDDNIYNGSCQILDNDFNQYETAIEVNNTSHTFAIHCNIFREGNIGLAVGHCVHPINFSHSNDFLGAQVGIKNLFSAPFLYGVSLTGSFPTTQGNVVPTPISNDTQPCRGRRMKQEQLDVEFIQNNNVLSILNLQEPSTISVVNALGQRIVVFKTEESGLDIDISNYDTGVYFVNVNGKMPTSFKFMK